MAIPLPADIVLEAAVRELLEAEGLAGSTRDAAGARPAGDAGEAGEDAGDAAVRITVSRGPMAGRGTLPPGWASARPTVVVQAWPFGPPPDALLRRGARAITSAIRRDPTSPLAGIKATSRADHVYAKLEAERAGVDDALFLTSDGRVSEATSANVFVVAGDALLTPPPSAAILAGTTRTWLLTDPAAGPAVGLAPAERDLWPADVLGAAEAFLSSAVAGLVPLVELDGRSVGDGQPGPRTRALREAREHWIRELGR
jgi:branched-subunit amino acid aminotransferase/4-amino-4-deoxychorismate lyase